MSETPEFEEDISTVPKQQAIGLLYDRRISRLLRQLK